MAIIHGHRIPRERSNNGVGSRGLDNSGATTGESTRAIRPAMKPITIIQMMFDTITSRD